MGKKKLPKRPGNKPVEKWTAADFIAESASISNNADLLSDEVVCGAMMLAALREGPRLAKLAKAISVDRDRLAPMFEALIFGSRKVYCDWFGENGGMSFSLDVCVGIGLMNRVDP